MLTASASCMGCSQQNLNLRRWFTNFQPNDSKSRWLKPFSKHFGKMESIFTRSLAEAPVPWQPLQVQPFCRLWSLPIKFATHCYSAIHSKIDVCTNSHSHSEHFVLAPCRLCWLPKKLKHRKSDGHKIGFFSTQVWSHTWAWQQKTNTTPWWWVSWLVGNPLSQQR